MKVEAAAGSDPHLMDTLVDCLAEMGLFGEGGSAGNDSFTNAGRQL